MLCVSVCVCESVSVSVYVFVCVFLFVSLCLRVCVCLSVCCVSAGRGVVTATSEPVTMDAIRQSLQRSLYEMKGLAATHQTEVDKMDMEIAASAGTVTRIEADMAKLNTRYVLYVCYLSPCWLSQ